MINEQYERTIEELKELDVYGCITGSSMLYDRCDFSQWNQQPDIDIFTYNPAAWVDAVAQVRYRLGYEVGTLDPSTKAGEMWKINRTRERGIDKKFTLTTIKLNKGGIVVNISCKPDQKTVTDVIGHFDQTCIMKGYDLVSGVIVDMTSMFTGDPFVSVLNPLRKQDADAYTVSQWLRQWDRVLKYYDRGFDTRKCADQYIAMIDGVLETGNMFTTEKSVEFYNEVTKDFVEMRNKMVAWKKEVDD